MAIKEAPLRPARFTIEGGVRQPEIRIPARKFWFGLVFLCFWLTMWTLGGMAAVTALFTAPEPFIAIWLIFWAIGWLFAASTILWQFTGSEVIRVDSGQFVHGWRLLGFSRERAYPLSQVRHLRINDATPFAFNFNRGWGGPFMTRRTGCISFDYGASTIRMGQSIDEAEGRMIVERLAPLLPEGAVDR
ncbi:hypothetical protein WBP07_18735 [Novosphingobium sp. BL-8A]|uniref:hypothetical protein n=1 Tax=Novosphingobium sp. BL-8A TaxID=3127639 RepID=UPI003756426B